VLDAKLLGVTTLQGAGEVLKTIVVVPACRASAGSRVRGDDVRPVCAASA
jgi:hypothetical protein